MNKAFFSSLLFAVLAMFLGRLLRFRHRQPRVFGEVSWVVPWYEDPYRHQI